METEKTDSQVSFQKENIRSVYFHFLLNSYVFIKKLLLKLGNAINCISSESCIPPLQRVHLIFSQIQCALCAVICKSL